MKKRVLNNKGFAVSLVLYTSVTLVVLILILIISILSTGWKSRSLIVDDIKKEVSGVEYKKFQSLGDIIITASDNKTSGQWHTTNIELTFSKPTQNGTEVNFPVTYYYGTSSDSINTKLTNNKISVTDNTDGTNYFVRACRGTTKDVCSKVGVYLVKIDKEPPTITVAGASTTLATSRTLTITPTSLSQIAYYQYYVSNFTDMPSDNDEIKTFSENQVIISDVGTYIFIRPVNKAGVKGSWSRHNLYVGTTS